MTITTERTETAKVRFYLLWIPRLDSYYPHQIQDVGADPNVIAKFKDHTDAQSFLDMRRKRYVETGE